MGERDSMTGADQDRREARTVDQDAAAEDVTRTLFELSPARRSPQAVAGRLIVELHNGQVSTTTIVPDAWGFVICIPVATRAHSAH